MNSMTWTARQMRQLTGTIVMFGGKADDIKRQVRDEGTKRLSVMRRHFQRE